MDQQHAQIFFSLYFAMTGMHALHMIIGVGLFQLICYTTPGKAGTRPEYHTPLEKFWPVLALCGHRLDLPVSIAVFD